MPPIVPRKRLSPSSDDGRPPVRQSKQSRQKKVDTTPKAPVSARRSTLWVELDSVSKRESDQKTKAAIKQMLDDEDDSTSLTSLSDTQFEDVPAAKRQKTNHDVGESDDDNDDDDEDIEFEDVPAHYEEKEPILESGDMELTLYRDNRVLALASELGKKGISKKDRAIRITTHCMHVQFLLWHNAVRNSWLCDDEVQAIMLSHLSPRLWGEIDRWRLSSGLEQPEQASEKEAKSKKNAKGKAKAKQKQPTRSAKNWSEAADRLEKGVPDMSHGDPLFKLVKCLLAWWKQRFHVTAPGLRKWGYMDVRRLANLRTKFEKEDHDPERFGEQIVNIEQFRQLALDCHGSRDVGAQLFTALLRGLGLEARMVANIQALGFGWSKAEEANEEKENFAEGIEADESSAKSTTKPKTKPAAKSKVTKKQKPTIKPTRRQTRQSDREALRIDIDDSDEYAEPISDSEDDSFVEDEPEYSRSKQSKSSAKSYDKDLEFPHYWTEILSPVTNTYLVVDPLVKSVVATNRELIESLEPRGAKADKAKQIMAYCVGYSQDGTAKDVTVRYLKKQIFPGKTKGVRIPEEKVPVYNKHGKVRRYDRFDWFKSVIRGYARGDKKHPITEIDEVEEATDLKPMKPEKKEVKEGEETLQYYKTSQEYVLRRHLKREEALPPSAVPVKVFRIKGKGGKFEEEDVFLRKDIALVKSAETWHKQGRAPIAGAEPLKHAPYRAATTNRRREIAEAEAAAGHKVLQPLYSHDQTDWIIPDPIKDGVIPKNEYGNIDMFAEHMCPEGAVHVPYRGTVRICRRLEIDYAEAVVGFEFGHRMAIPVIQGVVIAEENHERLIEELEKYEAEQARKADEKRKKAALGGWRKFLLGLRVSSRMNENYSHLDVPVDPSADDHHGDPNWANTEPHDEDMGGGFLPEGCEEEDVEEEPRQTSGFFAATSEAYDEEVEGEDPFHVEYHDHTMEVESSKGQAVDSNSDAESQPKVVVARKKGRKKAVPKPKQKLRRSARRRVRRNLAESSDDEEDEESMMLDEDDDI
ncbi:Rad4 transglutaminase-like domain-containing protein [Xylaria sp. CBS 124048]|nr:Rad4 transglutaminase-like domain-containing protein [Xylaria sp. CBS 124048]